MKKQNDDQFVIQTAEEQGMEIEIITKLMGTYLSEWEHRDTMLWKQVFTYFFASLIVMILPFIEIWDNKLTDVIPQIVFPIIGICLSVIFLIIGNGYVVRLKAISKTYQRLIEELPQKYQRIKLEEINPNSLANKRMSSFIVYTMFVLLVFLGVFLLFISMTS